MDRRQLKTRKAIINAFCTLLEKKRYEGITVQEIIELADVGRSTFYAHFETKDLLLDELCAQMFHHIFKADPCPWDGDNNSITDKLSHTLWHIRESKIDISALLLSQSGDLFLRYFKEHLHAMFDMCVVKDTGSIPRDFLISHLVGSFAEAVIWWLRGKNATDAESLAEYFVSVTGLAGYANSNI